MSMHPAGLEPGAFSFLHELEGHNDRSWFEPRRATFERVLLEPVAAMLEAASVELGRGRWPVSGGRGTILRQLRDQRYAKERPYATAVRALLTSTGATPAREGCVHVEVSSTGGFVGAGFHRPPASLLAPIRRRILEEPDRWRALVEDLRRLGLELADDRLTRMPRGFEHQRSRDLADDLRLRSIVVSRPIGVEAWTTGAAVDVIVGTVRAAMPLLRFGNDAAGFPPGRGADPP